LCHFSAAWPEGRSAWFRITLFPDPTLFAADPTLSDPTINFANPKFILQFSFLDPLISFLSKAQNAWINTFSFTSGLFRIQIFIRRFHFIQLANSQAAL
jgi:hypothetical protein